MRAAAAAGFGQTRIPEGSKIGHDGKRVRIVILGAGYAGLTALLELEDRLHRQDFDLVLVNATPFHYFVTELHTLAVGVQEEEGLRIPLRRVVRPPGRLVVARITGLDAGSRTVTLTDGSSLDYEYCIVGLGSDPEYFDIPGVAEHALLVGTPAAARRLREGLTTVLTAVADRPPRVIIAGGGLTGVELAGELADAYPRQMSITLIEAGPALMPGFDRALAVAAGRLLDQKDINVRTQSVIVGVSARVVQLDGGEEIPFDLLVWAGGVRGNAVLARAGLDVTPRGRARVDEKLRARGYPHLYVAGDAASFVDPSTGREIPPSAQAAVQMGRHAARNLLRRLQGLPEEPYLPRLRGVMASVGRSNAVGVIGDEKLSGLPAILVKRLIEAHHAFEAGGVVPIIQRMFRPATRLLDGRARIRRSRGRMPPVSDPGVRTP